MHPLNTDALVDRQFDRCRLYVLLFLVYIVGLAEGILILEPRYRPDLMAIFLFKSQDVLLLPVLFAALLARPRRKFLIRASVSGPTVKNEVWPILIAGCLLLVCWLGYYWVFADYDLSRDEQMADFDSDIFRHGKLFWPIAPFWRPMASALNQTFILPIGNHEAWVSAYLPVNAACRALVGLVADPALTSPLFVAIGALAIWDIGRRLWPELPSSRVVLIVLYAGSSQIVIAGMTAYAMSGHLGLDLLWLALFLRDRRACHAGAIGIGFLATGLHQPLFHPLFVLPFLDLLRQQGRWRLLAIYLGAYLLIGVFWMAWPSWISSHGVAPIPIHDNPAGIGFVGRLFETIGPFDMNSIWLMAANLVRFAVWQHVMLLPLLALGVVTQWRRDPLVRALTIGLCLPVVAMAVLLPYQGHGWGYRYLHGVLGNACLLGAYGWQWLEMRGYAMRRAFILGSAVSILAVLPVHAVMAHRLAAPFAKISADISASRAGRVVVDTASVPFGQDLVFNLPDLSNRPLRMQANELVPKDIALICQKSSVQFVEAPQLAPIAMLFGTNMPVRPTSDEIELEHAARVANCTIISSRAGS